MALITVRMPQQNAAPIRRSIYEVLEVPNVGASRRGSTYYKAMQLCPREFALRYVAGVHRWTRDNLTIGWLYHYCLELYYNSIRRHQAKTPMQISNPNWLWGGAHEGMDNAFRVLDKLIDEPGYGDVEAITRVTLEGYFEQFDRKDRWRIIAVEETLEHLRAPEYTTRLDLLIEDFDRGGMWVTEHKTAARITEDLIDNYQMDAQVLGQIWLLHKCVNLKKYPPFRGTLVSISCKGTRKRGPEFTRVEVCPSNAHLDSLRQTLQVRPKLLKVYEEMQWPRWLGNCSGFARGYSKCEFYDLCHQYPQKGVDYWAQPAVELPHGYSRDDAAGASIDDSDG